MLEEEAYADFKPRKVVKKMLAPEWNDQEFLSKAVCLFCILSLAACEK